MPRLQRQKDTTKTLAHQYIDISKEKEHQKQRTSHGRMATKEAREKDNTRGKEKDAKAKEDGSRKVKEAYTTWTSWAAAHGEVRVDSKVGKAAGDKGNKGKTTGFTGTTRA